MASFNDYLTADGQKILALMTKGARVTFTKVVLGDGIKKDGVSEVDIKEVINPVITLNIDSVTKSADNKVTIRSVFSNAQTTRAFFMLPRMERTNVLYSMQTMAHWQSILMLQRLS